jgi:hypothetical protein
MSQCPYPKSDIRDSRFHILIGDFVGEDVFVDIY